jgi:hypothetical protein
MNLSIKTDQCMEVIKSVIREARGHSVDLGCGLEGTRVRGSTDGFARRPYCPVTRDNWIK